MVRFIIGTILYAVCFMFVLPLINGIAFTGGFGTAIGLGVLYTVVAVGVIWVGAMAAGALGVVSRGVALLLLIPALLLGFWLIPAVVLKVLAEVAPKALSVSGWGPAIIGGLVMLVPGLCMMVRARASVTVSSSTSFHRRTSFGRRMR